MKLGFNHRPQRTLIVLCLVFAISLLLVGCGSGSGDSDDGFFRDPSGEPIKATVRTTVSLAFAASVAMEAVKGTPLPNVLVTNTCSSYPCLSVVTIQVDSQTMPFQFASYGEIVVAGYWKSESKAIITVVFVDMFAGSSLFSVNDVSTIPVSTSPSGLKIVYVSIDINIETGPVYPEDLTPVEIDAAFLKLDITPSDDPEANVGIDAWIVEAEHAGTPDDFSDDSYTILGGGEYIDASPGSNSILQLGMVGMLLEPACTSNPVAGMAVMQEVDVSSTTLPVLGQAVLNFGPECDGTAKVMLATGNYLLSNFQSIPLDLNAP